MDRIEVVRVCSDFEELEAATSELRPDVVVTDIRMPPATKEEGIRRASRLRTHHPQVGVVVLSQYVERALADMFFSEGTSGRGYLIKEHVTDKAQFELAIVSVHSGMTFIDPLVPLVPADRLMSGLELLTPAELDVLVLMAEAKSNETIANLLDVQKRTVEAHVGKVFKKLKPPDEADRRVWVVLRYRDYKDGRSF